MNIKLKTFLIIIATLILTIMFLVLIEIYRLYQVTTDLAVIEHERYEMTLKADELRQSSDDLTRMARTYVITKDVKFKNIYYKILAIRNGKAQRPKFYEGIYWNLSKNNREKYHPLQDPKALDKEMSQLPYSSFEIEELKKAKDNSDELAKLEIQAFKNLSIDILYSPKYYMAKEKIMLPIDHFLSSLRKRTQKEIEQKNFLISQIYKEIFTLFFIAFITIIIVIYVTKRKILQPIEYLHSAILAFRENRTITKKKKFYKDEIGAMISEFFHMKTKISQDKEKLHKLATTDPLTQIYNRRAFFEIAQAFFSLSQRENHSLSILILDIDFFKKVNDTYGHIKGDQILKHLVETVHTTIRLRKSDIFARYGGEEFIIMLANTGLKDAQKVAQKINTVVNNTPFIEDNLSIKTTISIGCSSISKIDTELNDIINRSDEALYKAKENGRNRVEIKE